MYKALGLSMVLGLIALIGCDRIKAPFGGEEDPLLREQYPHVATDEEVGDKIVFARAIVQPSEPHIPMRVVQPARNVHPRAVRVQYRFEFLDEAGTPLKSNLGWRYMNMQPRIEVFFEGAALESTATDWRLIVRTAR